MPIINFPVAETGVRFFDPVIDQIVEGVLRKLALRDYFQKGIYIKTSRRVYSLPDDGEGNLANLVRNRADIEVQQILNPESVPWPQQYIPLNNANYGVSAEWRNETTAVFCDRVAGVDLHERTIPSGLEMAFELTFQTADAANFAFSMLTSNSHGDLITGLHDIVYSYPVEGLLLKTLADVHHMRRSYTGTLPDYLSQYGKQRFQEEVRRTDIGLPNPVTQLVIKRQQLGCPGLLEFDQKEPDVEYDAKLPSEYIVRFTYKVQFGRPDCLEMYLPTVIENAMVSPDYFTRTSQTIALDLSGQLINGNFTAVARTLQEERKNYSLARIPAWDDFNPPYGGFLRNLKYTPMVIAAFTMDEGKLETGIPLTDMSGISFHPILNTILSRMSGTDLFTYQGILNVTVYVNNSVLDISNLRFDPQTLTVYIKNIGTNVRYHIVVSEASDLQYVHPKWYTTLMEFRWFFPLQILKSIDILIGCKLYAVTTSPDVIPLVNGLMRNGRAKLILADMVKNGDTNNWVYQYMTTAMFFCDYLTNTKSMLLGQTPPTNTSTDAAKSNYAGRNLMAAFIESGKRLGFINKSYYTAGYLRTPKGYPYGPNQGGFNGFVTPLRVFDAKFTISNPVQ